MLLRKEIDGSARKVLDKWVVGTGQNANDRAYFYIGCMATEECEDPDIPKLLLNAGYDSEEFSNFDFTDADRLASRDIATIFDNEMEDRNYHSFVTLFSSIRKAIQKILPGNWDARVSIALCRVFNDLFPEIKEGRSDS